MRPAAGLILGLLWVSLTLGVGNAADWAVVPSVTARTEFNSNLNYDFTAPKSDYIFTLAPTADFNYTTDIGQLQGRLGLTGRHYLSNGQLDHIDQNFQINGRYQAAPRLNLTLNTAYISDTSLQEEFATSGLIMTRTPRTSIQAGPGMTYALTERLSATVNYNFYKVDYQSQARKKKKKKIFSTSSLIKASACGAFFGAPARVESPPRHQDTKKSLVPAPARGGSHHQDTKAPRTASSPLPHERERGRETMYHLPLYRERNPGHELLSLFPGRPAAGGGG